MKGIRENYQLRYAAGKYWLLNMGQQGFTYQSPICMNETGAYLWGLYRMGMSRDEIAGRIAEEFEIDFEEARQDTDEFFDQIGNSKN